VVANLSRIQRGLLLGAVLGVTGLPVAADAHAPTLSGTIQYGTGGTAGGTYGNTSLTMQTFNDSKCTTTKNQGQETNGLDSAVVPVSDLVNHTLQLTWTHKGNTGNFGAAGVWVSFRDASCAKKPVPKEPVNAQYVSNRTFVVPAGMRWLVLQPETGITGVDWRIVTKHPVPPKKPKPKPKR